ncbi:MAG: PEP-CTERM sorting domain-containing protein [Phycisphaerae bacterium]|nr:PEP-CTERM sorting domain-containing protein [Phycisphaerae bacterium]
MAGIDAVFDDFTFIHNGGTPANPTPAAAWVPEGTGPVRGMIFLCPGRGSDSRDWMSDEMKLRARALGFGLVGWKCTGEFNSGGDYQGVNEAECTTNLQNLLDLTADACGRPEVSNCPVAYYGHSKGGWVANTFTARVPSRSIAFFSDKSSTWIDPPISAAAKEVPGMFVIGSVDPTVDPDWAWGGFSTWRVDQQANSALTVEWGKGHSGAGFDFAFSYLAEAIKERYPEGQVPSTVPGNPLVLNPVDPDGVYLAEASQLDGTQMTQVLDTHLAPADKYTLPVENASWCPNYTTALVNNSYKYKDFGEVLTVTIEESPFIELGESVTVRVDYVSKNPIGITELLLYLDDDEDPVDIRYDVFMNGYATVTYTPDEPGVHTLAASLKGTLWAKGMYSQYDVLYVQPVPEPATLLIVGISGTLLLRRKKGIG